MLDLSFVTKYKYYFAVLIVSLFVLIGLSEMLKPLFVIFFLSYLFNKPVTFLEKYYIKRQVSTFILISLFVCTLMVMMVFVIPLLSQKIISIIQKSPALLDQFIQTVDLWISKLSHKTQLESIKADIKSHLLFVLKNMLLFSLNEFSNIFSFKNIIYYFAATPILTYYMTVDFPYLGNFFLSLFPKKARTKTQELLINGEKMLSRYIHGQTIVCIALGLSYIIALYLIGLKHPVILGALMGALVFIPYIGAVLGFVMIILFMLADFYSVNMFIKVCSVLISLNILESQIIAPYIIGKHLGISPLILILALVVGHFYFGLIGMVLAYPLTATFTHMFRNREEGEV
ncbi:MAG: AI-2E family transporter [Alphaproteobacteria bacterium]|nr:MAG: AI-2E family transporter [Alphaproteobacteria bacterium]